ncbi:helix-turn-helix family protein [Clostridium botulinum 202F]|nr:helix-turn-helix family protein [Clostridium botulinum 202F]KAI3345970.1 helix-turn-helix transcriptional regulator [Clostridium botulinum]KON13463.1 transcriptional regulator [Clostridium botulinum]MBY6987829.1 helix-turn-helix transcriptional regulator [Clostridium botulinum]NFH02201.1 helix-turn-helix transcriptional regulator [Clostridium botulinum]
MIKMKLHIKLAEHRLNQLKISELTGIRVATINAYCNDKEKQISVEHLNKLCKYFKCNISDLVEYVEDEE